MLDRRAVTEKSNLSLDVIELVMKPAVLVCMGGRRTNGEVEELSVRNIHSFLLLVQLGLKPTLCFSKFNKALDWVRCFLLFLHRVHACGYAVQTMSDVKSNPLYSIILLVDLVLIWDENGGGVQKFFETGPLSVNVSKIKC